MIRRITILIAALAALAIIPAAASACQAEGGGTAYVPGTIGQPYYDGAAGISCTSATGYTYQIRGYFQVDSGSGFHAITDAATLNYTSGTAGRSFHYAVNCGDLPLHHEIFQRIRVKAVIENLTTHTTDVDYGPSIAARTNDGCNGNPVG